MKDITTNNPELIVEQPIAQRRYNSGIWFAGAAFIVLVILLKVIPSYIHESKITTGQLYIIVIVSVFLSVFFILKGINTYSVKILIFEDSFIYSSFLKVAEVRYTDIKNIRIKAGYRGSGGLFLSSTESSIIIPSAMFSYDQLDRIEKLMRTRMERVR